MTLSSQSKQKLYIGLGILLTICIITAIIIWRQFGNPANNTAAIDQSTPSAQSPTSTPSPTPTPTYDQAPPQIIGYNGQDGQTALDILLQLYPATKTTGDGVNTAVLAINGQPTAGQNKIWNFYLNGQLAQITPAAYVTTAQDKIEWRLEDF